jgi:hypothetical protein
MSAAWEIERASLPELRWICADCHLPNAEHPAPWWGCTGNWIVWARR